MERTFQIMELTLGNRVKPDRIVFNTIEDMKAAFKEFDDGKDILVVKDGLTTFLQQKIFGPIVYDGRIMFCAAEKPKEKK